MSTPKIQKGQFALGYNAYGELIGGQVRVVDGDTVHLSGISGGSVHIDDATALTVPENKVPDSRLKPHVVHARNVQKQHLERIAREAEAEAAKAKAAK